MKMKKWLAASVTLTFALATAGAVTAFAVTGYGGTVSPADTDSPADSNTQVSTGLPTYEEWRSEQTGASISPGLPTYNEWLEDNGTQVSQGIPTYEEWLAEYGDENAPVGSSGIPGPTDGTQGFDDGPVSGSIAVGEYYPAEHRVGKPEPDFPDGGPIVLPRPGLPREGEYDVEPVVQAFPMDGEVAHPAMEPTPVSKPKTVSIINVDPPPVDVITVDDCDSGLEVIGMPVPEPRIAYEGSTFQDELDALKMD